ncbi:MAG: Fe(2+)-trafficking protein [Phycisphaerales bacterium]|nr:Fe(2+)-trafficking protein [Phycisphaerales bacterium]
MELEKRIAQFENMAQADPTNDMAHFSLGSAYLQAQRFADAAMSFLRCTEVNPDMSKAFQLGGEAMIKAGDKRRAEAFLQQGYRVAALRGDLMPKKAIASLLQSLGAAVPEVKGAPEPVAPPGSFICQKTGRPGTRLERQPFKGPVGAWIQDNISSETWKDWIAQGTKVINELRLDLSRDEDAETYDRYMREYLGIDEALLVQLTGKSAAGA